MPGVTIAEPSFAGDDGAAHPAVAAALADYAAGRGSEHAALAALATARLLVPVVAILTEAQQGDGRVRGGAAGDAGGRRGPADQVGAAPEHASRLRLRREKTSEMALPTLVGNDGRRAVLAFTSVEALARWRSDARPVPVAASQVWQAGAQEADAVVVDVAGPVPLAVEGARLAALAGGRPVPAPHEDPDLAAAASAAAACEPDVEGIRLLPGSAESDLTVELTLRSRRRLRRANASAAIQRIAAQIMAASGGRLRRGIAVRLVEG